MANSAQARKRARQAEKRRVQNVTLRSSMRTAVKKVVYAIDAGDKEAASEAFKSAAPALDSAVTKGLLHRNNADRRKSRLNGRIKAL
ncbi:MAG: 30S ribosomal protein S20 [Gammaproteobacteria bacterium]|nr:MAG: 30S ribosomal protein S20 [Gammaproteobacteria bacterium]